MLFGDHQGHFAVPVGFITAPVLGNGHAPGTHHSPQVYRPAGLRDVCFHGHGAGIVVRGNGQGLDIVFRHTFQPDRLPDAALGRVEHAARLQGLLAPRLCAGVGGVLHRHPQAVAAGAVELLRDIQRKRPVAAPVSAHQMAIDLHRAGIVHRAEVQQHPAALPGRRSKPAVIVQPLAGLQSAPHPGSFCFRRVGHQNVAVPRSGAVRRGRDGILPQAVEVFVAVPAHGRAGVFGQRVHGLTAFVLLTSF